jgi:hypothetical protein
LEVERMARKVYCAREPDKLRQFGYCRDNRRKCRQAVIALIVTPGGLASGLRGAGGQHR